MSARAVGALLLAIAAAAGSVRAQAIPSPATGLFDTGDWVLVGGLVTAQLILMPLDDDVRDAAAEMRGATSDDIADILRPLGGRTELAALSAATWAMGRAISSHRVADFGLHAFVSLALSNVVTGSLKVVTGRSRPLVLEADGTWARRGPRAWDFLGGWGDDGARQSYPSGHATNAFALATVFAEELGGPAGWIAYPVAAGVAWSRVNDEAHWASDVAMGALVGIVSGQLVVRRGHRRGGWLERTFLEASPALDRLDIGLAIPTP
ncbi:MAG: phosphatase PAP2 family protein [Gemmatimonadales bacterium]